ncbi:MAG: ribosome small subunit-dependent GTPase A [Lachnospiraceae bacterium]|nr:ribosome small subunit-dependent GTPase A [Lachnospiraceae bacterium]
MNIIIRQEQTEDYYKTELMTMRAFWNVYRPGCFEHYLVHMIRGASEYVPEISRVAEVDGEIVGAIYYTRAKVVDGDTEHEVLTFGPLCVDPLWYDRGVGKRLLEETLELAREAGYLGVVIFGEPGYYPKFGFKNCACYGIFDSNGQNSDPFMAFPLNTGFSEVHGRFEEASFFAECENEESVAEFSKRFPFMKPLELECQPLHEFRLGRIASVKKNIYTIKFWESEIPAKLKGFFYEKRPDELPIVGDYVTFELNPWGESVITSVCARVSMLKRPDQAKTATDQYMVSNADLAFIVTSLNEDYSYNRIARYVSVALEGGVTPVVILTKMDLVEDAYSYVAEAETVSPGVKVHAVSATMGWGLDELREYLVPGVSICLLGSSGAGKSTLINALAGREVMKTAAIREDDGEGRHTTTHRQLIDLGGGVTIIDTPGMREIGLADVADGLEETFADIIELEAQCKFGNCRHETEPGCAIKAALRDGRLDPKRLELYRNFNAENTKNYAKKKEISKWVYQRRRAKGKTLEDF